MLPNKYIQPPTGFTQDNFWWHIGSYENIKIISNWHCILEKYLTDPIGNVFGLLTRKYLDLMERCSWLAGYLSTAEMLLKDKFLGNIFILHSAVGRLQRCKCLSSKKNKQSIRKSGLILSLTHWFILSKIAWYTVHIWHSLLR